jgi:Protein of unknown function (DUF3995)
MMLVASALALILWLIAGIHVYWGLGGHWPAADEQSLARTVVGAPDIVKMPSPSACFTVAVLLLALGVWPLVQAGLLPIPVPAWLQFIAGIGAILAFIGRGVVSYIPAFRHLAPDQPFATLDVRYYAPLCLVLGIGFLALLLNGGDA